ncbi:MAG TPA: hypothetical protein VJ673_11580 [Aromatoleum sp.]|uniref:hypothetical protein n=1 Tax=Aromatoleum sp. TaxID=2307007 RepID=UPI002B461FF2|nr:hypothetical protein [Aromatoleum sp.]HJV26323.1 hypothetical protein [Aromatoleum sp.]
MMEISPREAFENDFMCLGTLIARGVSHATLATAIENHGIYGWDQYGRFRQARGREKEAPLRLLARSYAWLHSMDRNSPYDDELDPLSRAEDEAETIFGWPADQCPDFDAIKAGTKIVLPPQRKGAETKVTSSRLVIIAALARALRIECGSRGAAARIADYTASAGTPVSEDTIRGILKEIPEAIERRRI